MSFRATALWRSFLVVSVLGLMAGRSAFGQAANSPIAFVNESAITTSFVSAPNLSPSGPSTGDEATQWLKVEFHYGTTPNLTSPFVDSVEFKVWIEGRDLYAPDAPKGQGWAVTLTGSVTYVNVPAGKDIYGVFYIPPSTLARYSEHGYSDFERKYDVHISAFVGGQEMDRYDKNKEADPNWYKAPKAIEGMVYRQNQTPFIAYDADRYPPIKLPAESSAQ